MSGKLIILVIYLIIISTSRQRILISDVAQCNLTNFTKERELLNSIKANIKKK